MPSSFFTLLLLMSMSASLGMRLVSRLAAIGAGLTIMLPSFAAFANQEIGSIPTTGFVFKDYLKGILALNTLYLVM